MFILLWLALIFHDQHLSLRGCPDLSILAILLLTSQHIRWRDPPLSPIHTLVQRWPTLHMSGLGSTRGL